MERLVFLFQTVYDTNGFFYARFGYIDLLETSHHTSALRKIAVVFLVRGRTDETDLSAFQIRFQHIGSIHGTVTGTPGSNQIMNLIYINDGITFLLHTIHYHFKPFLKITAILGSGYQSSQVQFINTAILETGRYISGFNTGCQTIYK